MKKIKDSLIKFWNSSDKQPLPPLTTKMLVFSMLWSVIYLTIFLGLAQFVPRTEFAIIEFFIIVIYIAFCVLPCIGLNLLIKAVRKLF